MTWISSAQISSHPLWLCYLLLLLLLRLLVLLQRHGLWWDRSWGGTCTDGVYPLARIALKKWDSEVALACEVRAEKFGLQSGPVRSELWVWVWIWRLLLPLANKWGLKYQELQPRVVERFFCLFHHGHFFFFFFFFDNSMVN